MEIEINAKKLAIVAVALALFGVFFFTKGFGLFSTGYVAGSTQSDDLKVALSDVSEQAKWYEYESGGKTIKFFVVKASDGSIKTAFDACDVCYKAHLGYRQEGNKMICNNCGKSFSIDAIGTENKNGGGCWPGYLPYRIVGDYLVVSKSDLEDNKWRF